MLIVKRTYTTAAVFVAVSLFLTCLVEDASAQATVRDSSPISTLAPPQPFVESQSVSYNFAHQVQQLQQEILELRGLLEEQGFEIKRLKQQRLDDYLDLDRRITELGSSVEKGSDNAVADSQYPASSKSTSDDAVVSNDQAEKKLYRDAIDKLLNKQDYQAAKSSFNRYLADYPQGTYTPNVYYWQGQIYLTESDPAAAEELFRALVDNYPDHQKSPDAKYKLATIYFEKGKKEEAKKLLDGVAASDTGASRLAKAFLASQYDK